MDRHAASAQAVKEEDRLAERIALVAISQGPPVRKQHGPIADFRRFPPPNCRSAHAHDFNTTEGPAVRPRSFEETRNGCGEVNVDRRARQPAGAGDPVGSPDGSLEGRSTRGRTISKISRTRQ